MDEVTPLNLYIACFCNSWYFIYYRLKWHRETGSKPVDIFWAKITRVKILTSRKFRTAFSVWQLLCPTSTYQPAAGSSSINVKLRPYSLGPAHWCGAYQWHHALMYVLACYSVNGHHPVCLYQTWCLTKRHVIQCVIRFLKSHNQVVKQLDLHCHDNTSLSSDILRLDSTNADALYVRGLCLYYEDCIDKAVQFFIQALRMAPDHEKARLACRVWLICFSISLIMISLLRWFHLI